MVNNKLSLADLYSKKGKDKIVWITSYDAQTARIAEGSGIDMILIGDSVGNNMLGYDSTIPVTMEDMIRHSMAVRRGAPNTFIIGDMPLGSYQASNADAINNALRFIKEARTDCVKLEGGYRMSERVKAMSYAGIAVMGHIGYTPQSTNLTSVVQSKELESFESLLNDAKSLEKSGAFAILLEAVPNEPAGIIAKELKIPIYGIGAGKEVDGVLAIVNDVIGLGTFKSRFVKNFAADYLPKDNAASVESVMSYAIKKYVTSVRSGEFPSVEHFYPIKDEALNTIKEKYPSKK